MSKSAKHRPASSSVSDRQELSRKIERNARGIIVLALGAHLLLCLVMFDPKLHTGGDNASYILLAESVLRTGDGYSLNMNPGVPEPYTLYPFGFPLLLALPLLLFGKNILALKALCVLCSLGSVLLFALIARRFAAPVQWCALVAAVSLNPIMVEYAHWILTEAPFLTFSLLAVYLWLRWEEGGGRSLPFFLGAAAAIAFTCLIRSAGVTLIAAAGLHLAGKRRWKNLALLAGCLVLLLAPWSLRNSAVRGASDTAYAGFLLMKNPYSPELGLVDAAGLIQRVKTNAAVYFLDQNARTIFAAGANPLPAPLLKLTAALISLLILTGLTFGLMRRRGLVDFYVLSTLGLALIWPEVWSDIRFVMPVIPFFLLYIAEGVSVLFEKMGLNQVRVRKAAVAAIAVFAAVSLFSQLAVAGGNLRMLSSYAGGDRYSGYPQIWRDFFSAAEWARDNTLESSVICVRKPTLFNLVTDRKVLIYPFSTDTDSVLAIVRQCDYVVIDAVSGTTGRYLIPALQKQPDRYKVVFNLQYAKVVEVLK